MKLRWKANEAEMACGGKSTNLSVISKICGGDRACSSGECKQIGQKHM